MDNLDKQIQDFWENRTSPEQRREILRQLEESGMEWKEFLLQYYQKVLAGEEPSNFSAEQKSRVWQRLEEQHFVKRRVMWFPWAAAACVLFIVGLAVFYMGRKPAVKALPVAPETAKMIIKKNAGVREDSLTLPDHSMVLLAPGSSISYLQSFEARARNIQLEGRALFEVAKDSLRPFTVTAQGYATTALGTRFIVDATKRVVSIRLIKGKIVVRSIAGASVAMEKVYLKPGQVLRINTDKRRPNSVSEGDLASLSFERTSLATVFRRLSQYYKTPILYDKAEVQGLSFTGDFKPYDELDLALKVVCNMNKLSFTKVSDHIVISKQQ